MTALLIVDVQNDFLPAGSLPVPHGDAIIPIINALQKNFIHVIASKDWHPQGHISFASTHQKKVGDKIRVDGGWQLLWPDHCVQGTKGADFPPQLKTDTIERVILKGNDPYIDSYSAFFDNGKTHSTGLDTYLKNIGVTKVVVVGLATEYCVRATVLDACSLGFQVEVILNGCQGIEQAPGDVQRALQEMERAGAHLL